MATVPFKLDGGLWFVKPASDHPNQVWREADQFEAELKLVSYQKTSNGDFYLWADTQTNVTYPMLPEEMYEMLLKAFVEDGFIEGVWTVVQRGNKFSVSLIEEFID